MQYSEASQSSQVSGDNSDDDDDDDDLNTSKKGPGRGKNWTSAALERLTELCAENWETINAPELEGAGRKGKGGTNRDDIKKCWNMIVDKVNAIANQHRTLDQIKRKFKKIKSDGNFCCYLLSYLFIEFQVC